MSSENCSLCEEDLRELQSLRGRSSGGEEQDVIDSSDDMEGLEEEDEEEDEEDGDEEEEEEDEEDDDEPVDYGEGLNAFLKSGSLYDALWQDMIEEDDIEGEEEDEEIEFIPEWPGRVSLSGGGGNEFGGVATLEHRFGEHYFSEHRFGWSATPPDQAVAILREARNSRRRPFELRFADRAVDEARARWGFTGLEPFSSLERGPYAPGVVEELFEDLGFRSVDFDGIEEFESGALRGFQIRPSSWSPGSGDDNDSRGNGIHPLLRRNDGDLRWPGGSFGDSVSPGEASLLQWDGSSSADQTTEMLGSALYGAEFDGNANQMHVVSRLARRFAHANRGGSPPQTYHGLGLLRPLSLSREMNHVERRNARDGDRSVPVGIVNRWTYDPVCDGGNDYFVPVKTNRGNRSIGEVIQSKIVKELTKMLQKIGSAENQSHVNKEQKRINALEEGFTGGNSFYDFAEGFEQIFNPMDVSRQGAAGPSGVGATSSDANNEEARTGNAGNVEDATMQEVRPEVAVGTASTNPQQRPPRSLQGSQRDVPASETRGVITADAIAAAVSAATSALALSESAPVDAEEQRGRFQSVAEERAGALGISLDAPASTDPAVVEAAMQSTGIDPTFLAELPEDMRTEVLAQRIEQLASEATMQGNDGSNVTVSPEFLAALPPDVRAEVLVQEAHFHARREREIEAEAVADPANAADMDNASFLATLQPQLREDVLLSADESFLSTLPPALSDEARLLRERFRQERSTHWRFEPQSGQNLHARGGNSNHRRLRNIREFMADQGRRQVPDWRIVDGGEWTVGYLNENESRPFLNESGLASLVKLLYLQYTLGKGLMSRVFAYACKNTQLRKSVIRRLIHILYSVVPGYPSSEPPVKIGKSAGGVGGEADAEPLPRHMVVRRALELLTNLAKNDGRVAETIAVRDDDEQFFNRLLRLLGMDLFTRSTAHLEQLVHVLAVACSALPSPRSQSSNREQDEESNRRNGDESQTLATENDTSLQENEMRDDQPADPVVAADQDMETEGADGAASDFEPALFTHPVGEGEASKEKEAENENENENENFLEQIPYVEVRDLESLAGVLSRQGCSERTYQRVIGILDELSVLPRNRLVAVNALAAEANQLGKAIAADFQQFLNQLKEATSKGDSRLQAKILSTFSTSASSNELKLLRIAKTIATLARTDDRLKYAFSGLHELWENLGQVLDTIREPEGTDNGVTTLLAAPTDRSATMLTNGSLLSVGNVSGTVAAISQSGGDNLVPQTAGEARLETSGSQSLTIASAITPSSQESRSYLQPDSSRADEGEMSISTDGLAHSTRDTSTTLAVPGMLTTPVTSQTAAGSSQRRTGRHNVPPALSRLSPVIQAFFVAHSGGEEESSSTNDTSGQQPSLSSLQSPTHGPIVSQDPQTLVLSSSMHNLGEPLTELGQFVEKHRVPVNMLLRATPSLLEGSFFKSALRYPQWIDFDNKKTYFRTLVKQRTADVHPSAIRIRVRREQVFEDSYNRLRIRTADEMKGRLHVQFMDEEGIDAGGVTREWYTILARKIFDANYALFRRSAAKSATYQPNTLSYINEDHLGFFRFVGRIIGKAIYDGQLLDAYFTRSFYKHMLGIRPNYHDLEALDPEYYKSICWLLENDITGVLDLTMSAEYDDFGVNQVVDLIPNGREIPVSEENKREYVRLVTDLRLTKAIKHQIEHFLEGFQELIPREDIRIFNELELELLMSGLPDIDVSDLKANVEYSGYTPSSPQINWFWRCVAQMGKEDLARLIMFTTGTSKVPLEGFAVLQGMNGIQKFHIHCVAGDSNRLPTAHTCFNQLDLPEYSSEQKLQSLLLVAIREGAEGFGFG